MPRKKLSEFRSKSLIHQTLGLDYIGWSLTKPSDVKAINGYLSYVVKVDQAVKGRFKKGLVKLDVKQKDLPRVISELFDQSYTSLIVEPFVEYASDQEKYLSISQDRRGVKLSFSNNGGVDIESKQATIETFIVDDSLDLNVLSVKLGFSEEQLKNLLDLYNTHHFVFLEINPYITQADGLKILDSAVEVDDAGQYFVEGWKDKDIRYPRTAPQSESEIEVNVLNNNSAASFNLSVLNPNGSIFLLLSGGGASVVIADEVHNAGFSKELANYGEYSGNPNTQETYIYTKQVLKLMLASNSKTKVLFIGGAVANFTDIANTFSGIIQAFSEYDKELREQSVKVFVRRGGPNQTVGLAKMNKALTDYDILGGVYGPEVSIITAINTMLKVLKK